MEVRGYKSGAMCNPKISVTEVKLTPRGIPGSARAPAPAEPEVCHSSVNHPHTWKCAPTSSAKTGLRSYAQHPTFTQTAQEPNIFVSKLKETGKTIITWYCFPSASSLFYQLVLQNPLLMSPLFPKLLYPTWPKYPLTVQPTASPGQFRLG